MCLQLIQSNVWMKLFGNVFVSRTVRGTSSSRKWIATMSSCICVSMASPWGNVIRLKLHLPWLKFSSSISHHLRWFVMNVKFTSSSCRECFITGENSIVMCSQFQLDHPVQFVRIWWHTTKCSYQRNILNWMSYEWWLDENWSKKLHFLSRLKRKNCFLRKHVFPTRVAISWLSTSSNLNISSL